MNAGRLWSPGVRDNVKPGSAFHRTEYFGPVLGIMTAATLDEAIELQNATDYGLTAGIHSLEPDEVSRWIELVDAGNLYVNRGITGAIVRRQPFGGWKRSTVGTSTKAGGPNYLMTLGAWKPLESDPGEDLTLEGISDPVARVIKRAQAGLEFLEFDRVRLAAVRDEKAWLSEFGVARDVSHLGVERNVFRYRPMPVTIRLSEGASLGDLIRLIVAGTRTGSVLFVSTASPLPQPLVDLFGEPVSRTLIQSRDRRIGCALARAPGRRRVEDDAHPAGRRQRVCARGHPEGRPGCRDLRGPVTTAGRLELLPFLHEQAVSITAHRFGNPDRASGRARDLRASPPVAPSEPISVLSNARSPQCSSSKARRGG